MKKTILSIVMAALCLFLSVLAIAQTPANQAVDITAKGLQVGQKLPDIPELSRYKGKLIILDFWATWCSPCIAMIPKMEALQEQFKDKLQIVQVTYQQEKEVSPFLERLRQGKAAVLPSITSDKELHKLFPHIYLPHYVWIGQDGVVRAITEAESVTASNIEQVLKGTSTRMERKHDMKIAYSSEKPFLLNGNGGDGRNLIYHSVLTNYTEGLTPSISLRKEKDGSSKMTLRNVSALALFQRAYSTYNDWYNASKTSVRVKDASGLCSDLKGQAYDNYLRTHGYCYELILPSNAKGSVGEVMRQNLTLLFPQYTSSIEQIDKTCWALVRTSTTDKIAHKGIEKRSSITAKSCDIAGASLAALMINLKGYYLQNSEIPVVDATGYKGLVDIHFKADMSSISDINRALKAYDLQFEKRDMKQNILVISDSI